MKHEETLPSPKDVNDDNDLREYRERVIAAVRQGLADVEAGRLLEDEEVRRLLDEEFGPLPDEPDP